MIEIGWCLFRDEELDTMVECLKESGDIASDLGVTWRKQWMLAMGRNKMDTSGIEPDPSRKHQC